MRSITGGKTAIALAIPVNTLVCVISGSSVADSIFTTLLFLVFTWIALWDAAHHRIPNKALILVCLLKGAWICFSAEPVHQAVDGVLTGAVICVLLLLVGMAGGKRGLTMGAGDYKYMVALAFCMGCERTLAAFVIAWVLFLGTYLWAGNKRDRHKRIALAPFLSLGAMVSLCAAALLNCG